MGQQLSADAVTKFTAEVKHVFQPMVADIKSAVRVINCAGAKTVQIPVIGKSVTSLRTNKFSPIPIFTEQHAPVVASVQDYAIAEASDIFLGNQTNYDERQELAKSIAMSLERRMLQIVIDALGAATIAKTVAKNVSGSNDNLNLTMLRAAARLLEKDGAFNDPCLLGHINGFHYLPKDTAVASIDSNSVKVLPTGICKGLYGFKFLRVCDMPEGGLPLSGNDRTAYAFDKDAIALAINMEPKVSIDWEPDLQAHRITGTLSAVGVVVDATGVVKVTCDESQI